MTLARRILLFSCLPLAFACGDPGDGPVDVDAPPPDVDAPPPDVQCMIEGDQGTIAPAQNPRAFIYGGEAATRCIDVGAPYNQLGTETDWFVFRLVNGKGYFADGIKPGTFEITGPETDFKTCSACVFLVGDHSGDMDEEDFNTFMATSGTLVVDSVSPTFSATLTNASFRHVAFNGETQVPNPSGCAATVSSVSATANLIPLPLTALPDLSWLKWDDAVLDEYR